MFSESSPLFVAKGHRLQRQDGFARQTHRLDMALKPGGGSRRPEAAFVVHKDGRSSGDRRPEDPRNIDRVVNSPASNADPAGIIRQARAADVDVTISGREFAPA